MDFFVRTTPGAILMRAEAVIFGSPTLRRPSTASVRGLALGNPRKCVLSQDCLGSSHFFTPQSTTADFGPERVVNQHAPSKESHFRPGGDWWLVPRVCCDVCQGTRDAGRGCSSWPDKRWAEKGALGTPGRRAVCAEAWPPGRALCGDQ